MTATDIFNEVRDGTMGRDTGLDFLEHFGMDAGWANPLASATSMVDNAVADGIEAGTLDADGLSLEKEEEGDGAGTGTGTGTEPTIKELRELLSATASGREDIFKQFIGANVDPNVNPLARQALGRRFAPLEAQSLLNFIPQFTADPERQFDFASFIQNQQQPGMLRQPLGQAGFLGEGGLLSGVEGLFGASPAGGFGREQIAARQFLEDNAGDLIPSMVTAGVAPLMQGWLGQEVQRRLGALPIGTNPFAAFVGGGGRLPNPF
jgi:hypothetical protein